MQRRTIIVLAGAAVAGIVLLGFAAVSADDPTPAFALQQLGYEHLAREPVLDYGEDGAVWYAGMNDSDPGNLWRAANDQATFVKQADPPTDGGADAVVHRDGAGRIFWATLDPSSGLQVAVHQADQWSSANFGAGDRPWFGTSGGITYIAYLANAKVLLSKWTGSAWEEVNGPNNPIRSNSAFADMAVASDGRLHLLIRDATSPYFLVGSWLPGDMNWAFTPSLALVAEGGTGIPRLAVDDTNKVYVVAAEIVQMAHTTWLHPLRNGTWAGPYLLGPPMNTTTKPAVVAGASGKIGVAWYQTAPFLLPSTVPVDTVWDLHYALFSGATGTPQLVSNVKVQASAHIGPTFAHGEDVGDFTFAIERKGNPERRVALAWGCTTVAACPGGQAGVPPPVETRPMFAVQTGGEGLT